MRRLLPTIFILSALFVQGQPDVHTDFIYGTMQGDGGTLTGYFKFDRTFSQNGETVYFKEDSTSRKTKKFPSRRYMSFTSDSLYMETFGVLPTITGDILVMVPRILNGPMQLFYFPYGRPGTIIAPKYEPYHIKASGYRKRVSRKKFKNEMSEILSSNLLKYIEDEKLKYDDPPIIVQLANAKSDKETIEYVISQREKDGNIR